MAVKVSLHMAVKVRFVHCLKALLDSKRRGSMQWKKDCKREALQANVGEEACKWGALQEIFFAFDVQWKEPVLDILMMVVGRGGGVQIQFFLKKNGKRPTNFWNYEPSGVDSQILNFGFGRVKGHEPEEKLEEMLRLAIKKLLDFNGFEQRYFSRAMGKKFLKTNFSIGVGSTLHFQNMIFETNF